MNRRSFIRTIFALVPTAWLGTKIVQAANDNHSAKIVSEPKSKIVSESGWMLHRETL